MVQDRVESDTLELAQEFFSNMLASRRMTVTKDAGVLEELSALEYRRGTRRILDPARVIPAACVCYPIVHSLLQGLYERPQRCQR